MDFRTVWTVLPAMALLILHYFKINEDKGRVVLCIHVSCLKIYLHQATCKSAIKKTHKETTMPYKEHLQFHMASVVVSYGYCRDELL